MKVAQRNREDNHAVKPGRKPCGETIAEEEDEDEDEDEALAKFGLSDQLLFCVHTHTPPLASSELRSVQIPVHLDLPSFHKPIRFVELLSLARACLPQRTFFLNTLVYAHFSL